MAKLKVDSGALVLKFGPFESLLALCREASVPVGNVTSVEVASEPWNELKGIRIGTGLPGMLWLGTLWRRGGRDLAAVRGRSPALVVKLREGSKYQRFVVTGDEADAVILRRELGLA